MNAEQTPPTGPRAVPDPNVPDRRAAVARWIITWSEPLLSTRARANADAAMAQFIQRNSRWSIAWFAGVISDVAATLPPEDPWRRLSARLEVGEGEPLTFTHPLGAPAPETTGAVRPDGIAFSGLADSTDIVFSDLVEAPFDLGLAAVTEEIDPRTAAVIGFSAANVSMVHTALDRIYHDLWWSSFEGNRNEVGPAFLEIAGDALRRLVHRRRTYTSQDDPFANVAGFAWMARADRVVAGTRNIDSEIPLARDARIDPGEYDFRKMH